MAKDDSTTGPTSCPENDNEKPFERKKTIQELAAEAMESPLVRETTAKLDAKRVQAKKKAAKQLGAWAEDQRGCPNAMLRAALFCAGKPPTRREFFEQLKLVESLAPYVVSYTGPRLYQPDLDVWLELVHRSRQLPPGAVVEFPIRAMLRALKRNDGKSDRDWLIGVFARLRANALDVSWKDPDTGCERGYIRGLVQWLDHDKDRKLWRVCLDPEVTKLFAPDQHTWISSSARHALGKSYLAKWLHGYFSSHRKPQPISVRRLYELSGSDAVRLRRFREGLKEALDEVVFVELVEQRRFEWRIDDDDLVHVLREHGN
jgi:hypothetical protein